MLWYLHALHKNLSFSDIISKGWPHVSKKDFTGKPVQGALKLDIYLDNSAKNTFLQR